MYEISWEKRALDELYSLEELTAKRIIKKVEELKENTFSKDIKKLKGQEKFRLRIGYYRIIFELQNNLIKILMVGHRKNIYKKSF